MTACTGRQCTWSASSTELGCGSSGSGCFNAKLATSSRKDVQDDELLKATAAINEILAAVKPFKDRKLSFIVAADQVMLAWVNHDRHPQQGDITPNSADKDVETILGLI